MEAGLVVYLADLCQLSAGIIATSAYIPQISKIYRTNTAEGMALSSWIIWLCSSLLALFYAGVQFYIHGTGIPLVITTSVNCLLVGLTVLLLLRCSARQQNPEAAFVGSSA
jgi:uncharacterized protein with PQ loop repeat